MASRATNEKWLAELTNLPTASGKEDAVVEWVSNWVARRDDLKLTKDSGGNLLITQKGRKRHPLVLAVAHMDHPAFVIDAVDGGDVSFEFRGGVSAPYFQDAIVEVVSRPGGVMGRVAGYDSESQTGKLLQVGREAFEPGDIVMWKMRRPRPRKGRFRAPACDDLAGGAAALSALDRARSKPGLRHFGVLLTRAEEVGLVGAIHAAKHQTIPTDARILSIETSRELPTAPIGEGPVIRTGDYSTVFHREMTNKITFAARTSGIKHQRKLMDGGGCEATAFGTYGYEAAGLCVPLGNWHNRGNLTEVEAGRGKAIPMLEEISLDDYHGLVELLLIAARAVDAGDPLRERLDKLYESQARYLD